MRGCPTANLKPQRTRLKTLTPTEKPIFIPLRAEWYEAFERGEKTEEIRQYGRQWNEKTCRVGRAVTLSYGYGKARRLHGVISGFRKMGADTYPGITGIYPSITDVAAIRIELAPKTAK
jgi:hypothetical protein